MEEDTCNSKVFERDASDVSLSWDILLGTSARLVTLVWRKCFPATNQKPRDLQYILEIYIKRKCN